MISDARQLKQILRQISIVRVGVIGDFCLDVYWELDDNKTERSVETGLKTRAVKSESFSPGGAANVAMNLSALGIQDVYAIGCVGQDPYGEELARQLSRAGVSTTSLIRHAGWHTHLFIKPHLSGKEESRIDIGNYNHAGTSLGTTLLEELEAAIESLDAIIVNQQIIPGATIMSDTFRPRLAGFLAQYPSLPVVVDSRNHADDFKGFIIKMNESELLRYSCGGESYGASDTKAIAITVSQDWGSDLIITRGEAETIIVTEGEAHRVPTFASVGGSIDTVGAGDAFVATYTASLAGESVTRRFSKDAAENAACIAHMAAAVTIGKTGTTGTATPEEIADLFSASWYVYSPEHADDMSQATYHDGTQIETIRTRDQGSLVRHVIFDHDGTISTLREGWEGIMEPMMVKAIVGNRDGDLPDGEMETVVIRVRSFISRTTGVQTLAQMAGLVELVKEFNLVPPEAVLDPYGYKDVYNGMLMRMVEVRKAGLENGTVCADSRTVPGVQQMLQSLRNRGLNLYLASGTDRQDVVDEATLLGYDSFFNGGIYGATGRIDVEAKREVITAIIEETGASSGEEILVFGDGPVEIREGIRCGGFGVGVASDERLGTGIDANKRNRLIRAGAHAIIPDFRRHQDLTSYLIDQGVLAG